MRTIMQAALPASISWTSVSDRWPMLWRPNTRLRGKSRLSPTVR